MTRKGRGKRDPIGGDIEVALNWSIHSWPRLLVIRD
jgi:hypothetical protein